MRLLGWDLDRILREVEGLDKESAALKADLIKLCWFMRGGITLDDVYSMSYDERMMIAAVIEENLETTKKTGMPFF
jgi:hypothetical protein